MKPERRCHTVVPVPQTISGFVLKPEAECCSPSESDFKAKRRPTVRYLWICIPLLRKNPIKQIYKSHLRSWNNRIFPVGSVENNRKLTSCTDRGLFQSTRVCELYFTVSMWILKQKTSSDAEKNSPVLSVYLIESHVPFSALWCFGLESGCDYRVLCNEWNWMWNC